MSPGLCRTLEVCSGAGLRANAQESEAGELGRVRHHIFGFYAEVSLSNLEPARSAGPVLAVLYALGIDHSSQERPRETSLVNCSQVLDKAATAE